MTHEQQVHKTVILPIYVVVVLAMHIVFLDESAYKTPIQLTPIQEGLTINESCYMLRASTKIKQSWPVMTTYGKSLLAVMVVRYS